jgi:hypothetical protein
MTIGASPGRDKSGEDAAVVANGQLAIDDANGASDEQFHGPANPTV